MFNSEKGSVPILFLFASLGLLIFLLISNTFSFKDTLFNTLFPKPPSHAQEVSPSVPDEILLKFKPGISEEAKENIKNQHALEVLEAIPQIEVLRVKVNANSKDAVIEALSRNPNVEYAEPNYINQAVFTPNDTYFENQWAIQKISAPQAWDISQGSPSVVIAVLDSGVDFTHEDLVNKGTGALDDYRHGTQVAGVVTANTNNATGLAGVCPLCQIMSVKVLSSTGAGSDSTVAVGIIQAADNGAKVINLSLGGYATTTTMNNAVNYAWNKGVVIVGAGGNDNTSMSFYPAAHSNVVAVGATSYHEGKAVYSNYGSWLDISAPGDDIYTTLMNGGYEYISGTSLAAPHVAALAGLIFSAKPGLTNQQVVDIITSSADDLGAAGKDDYFGYGRINAYKALQMATGIVPAPTSTPTASPTPSPTPTPTSTPSPTAPPVPSDTIPPTVSITNPLNGSIVKPNSKLNIQATASDNIAISKVEFYQGTTLKCTDTTSPYSCIWSVPGKKNTNYTITVKAYDSSNNTSSASVSVKAQ